jgi:hypothetical protein
MFRLFEESGFSRVRSAVVPGFRFRKGATQDAAEAYGVKAVMMTALKAQHESQQTPASGDTNSR